VETLDIHNNKSQVMWSCQVKDLINHTQNLLRKFWHANNGRGLWV